MIKHGDKQKRKILDAGLKIWRAGERLTLRAVADAVGVTHAAVLYHFKEDGLFDAVAAHAVDRGDSHIIVQLIAQGHAAVKDLSPADRRKHMKAMI